MSASIPGCKTLLPKIVACEGPLIMMTGSLKKKKKKIKDFFFQKKGGGSLIRACSLIRSNTVHVKSPGFAGRLLEFSQISMIFMYIYYLFTIQISCTANDSHQGVIRTKQQ